MKLLLDERNLLKNPVGCWLAKPHQEWKWFYARQVDVLFCKDNIHYTSYTRGHLATRTSQIFFRSEHQSQLIGVLY